LRKIEEFSYYTVRWWRRPLRRAGGRGAYGEPSEKSGGGSIEGAACADS
jgi:hypothetical protein